MLLVHLLKILFSVLIISHCIRWVSYHIRHHNKKARVFNGNTRLPKDLEFALMYGFLKRRKKRAKDLSYRKSLSDWKELLNTIYPAESELNISLPLNSNLAIPKGDFGSEQSINGNEKQFAFPKTKTRNNNFTKIKKINTAFTAKPFAKNNGLVSSLLANTKIVNLTNLKISSNLIPFTKQTFACPQVIFTIWFHYIFFPFPYEQ